MHARRVEACCVRWQPWSSMPRSAAEDIVEQSDGSPRSCRLGTGSQRRELGSGYILFLAVYGCLHESRGLVAMQVKQMNAAFDKAQGGSKSQQQQQQRPASAAASGKQGQAQERGAQGEQSRREAAAQEPDYDATPWKIGANGQQVSNHPLSFMPLGRALTCPRLNKHRCTGTQGIMHPSPHPCTGPCLGACLPHSSCGWL